MGMSYPTNVWQTNERKQRVCKYYIANDAVATNRSVQQVWPEVTALPFQSGSSNVYYGKPDMGSKEIDE